MNKTKIDLKCKKEILKLHIRSFYCIKKIIYKNPLNIIKITTLEHGKNKVKGT